MFPILILREELVCLILLIFLAFISRTYRMGVDGKDFNRMLMCSLVHLIADMVTLWTANHADSVPRLLNDGLHVVMYLSAVMFGQGILIYVVRLVRPEREQIWSRFSIGAGVLYLALLPFLKIEYRPYEGIVASNGTAVYAAFLLGYLFLFATLGMIFRYWTRLPRHVKLSLVPMLLILLIAETIQIFVRPFRFSAGAVTAVTVGFFFSLENPAAVLERKAMVDAMTGVENRNCYERDIREYDRMYQANRKERFIFLFCDMNNLKSVNGMFGHDEGDHYITFIAVTMLNHLKSAEHIYRMGGDEFLALYRNVDEETVIREVDSLHEACVQEGKKRDYQPMLATGYAVSGPQYKNLHDVLRVADYMMYQNKAELKREISEGVTQKGTSLNLTGLMDRVFDAMCLTSDAFYPYLTNLETSVTRIAPRMRDTFGLDNLFYAHFSKVWMERIHPEDRQIYQDDLMATLKGEQQYHLCEYRVLDRNGNYVRVLCRGGMYHGKDGEPDIFSGYLEIRED